MEPKLNGLDEIALDPKMYADWYRLSLTKPDQFWEKQAKSFINWYEPFHTVQAGDFAKGDPQWFLGGKLNACYNCLDKHLPQAKDRIAFIWVQDGGERHQSITFQSLLESVCRVANTLKSLGIRKGDRVALYMPMIPESIYSILACARIGAVHTVVFAGFSAASLHERLRASDAKLLITADGLRRGGKELLLKPIVDEAVKELPLQVLVTRNLKATISMDSQRDKWFDAILSSDTKCEPEVMDSEDPLFILYTSGSTGKPKGLVHTHGGYLVYAAATFRFVFDYKATDIYWCTADIGWITGHSYLVYGPLLNGATSVFYEGIPTSPDPATVWKIVDQFQVGIFYTAPTAIRALMAHGNAPLKKSHRKSLRVLGTVGEPINPSAWKWYFEAVGDQRCYIVDTWWQTETGGICIAPIPGVSTQKPGFACSPFFGIEPEILDEDSKPVAPLESGYLVLKRSWPGQARTIFGDHDRYVSTYYGKFPGKYFTGDGAYIDAQGDIHISGRTDDVINVSGHRIGTEEIESALVLHPSIIEAAVVGKHDPIRGEVPYAFACLAHGEKANSDLSAQCKKLVKQTIGNFACPKEICFVQQLPKTRSGKILRRVLRDIANSKEPKQFGDLSTLADPEAIDHIIQQQKNIK